MRIGKFIIDRIKLKARQVLPILIGGLVVYLIIFIILQAARPFFPETYAEVYGLIGEASWPETGRKLSAMVEGLGAWGPLVYIGLNAAQVVVSPLPGQVFGLSAGFLFGVGLGLVYASAGLVLGSFIAMLAGRLIGRSLAGRSVSHKVWRKYYSLVEEGRVVDYFMIFLLPALPDDAVCFIAGLSRLSIPKLLLAGLLGRLPGMAVLAWVGANLKAEPGWAYAVPAAALAGAFFIWFFDREFKQLYFHLRDRIPSTG